MEPITIAIAAAASLISFLAKDVISLIQDWLNITRENEYTIEHTKHHKKMLEVDGKEKSIAQFEELIEKIKELQLKGDLNIENIDFENQKVSIELGEKKPTNNKD